MIAPLSPTFAQLVQDFFCTHLVRQRNASACTIRSYRDTFRLFLRFLKEELGKEPSKVDLSDLTPATIEAFLSHLESSRGNAIRTRNNRFAAIRSFLKYSGAQDPGNLAVIRQVLAIPMKRFDRVQLGYLSREEMQAILQAPDCSTWSGRRDLSMFATMYNTGARVSEITALRRQDVSLAASSSVRIRGKGRKERAVPLWKDTVRHLRKWMNEIQQDESSALFPNARGNFMTRSGVEYRLKRAVTAATTFQPALKGRRISPHTLRHTTAMHLLQSGVDITVIALWLGHETSATTHMYVEADLKMKEKALGRLQEPKTRHVRYRPRDKLLQFLEEL